jgi:Raf kinase inhibitor-like YbhB/YbcL family protein
MPNPATFTLRSSAFAEGGSIPRGYTCDGDDVSPPLEWSGAPASTAAYVLLVTDPDARGFVHWVAVDLSGSSRGLAERASGKPAAGNEGRNDFGRTGWGGPCPPSGTHRYVFELYALSSPLNLPGRPTAADVRRALGGRVVGEARLTGTYRRR